MSFLDGIGQTENKITVSSHLIIVIQFKHLAQGKMLKKLQNPTAYFFAQAENIPDTYTHQIDLFVSKMLDKDKCLLCRNSYDVKERVPRIMIHCGHTFCTICLANFYTYLFSL